VMAAVATMVRHRALRRLLIDSPTPMPGADLRRFFETSTALSSRCF
jgi:hypothetical protein